MTAVMLPIGGSGGSGAAPYARNNRGNALVPGGATVTLVSFTAGTHRLRGFTVEGDTDGFAWIEVDGVPLDGMAARHSRVLDAYRALPNAEAYASPLSVVALKVTNTDSVAHEFAGVVFGE
jgi:hypothetical protein